MLLGWMNGSFTSDGKVVSTAIALPLASVLIAVGMAISFGQRKLIVDGHSRTVSSWVGAVFPIWKRTVPWSAVDEVSIESVQRSAKVGTVTRWVVNVEGSQIKLRSVDVWQSTEARRVGRRVAVFMKRPLRNRVDGSLTPFEDLQGTLGQRLRRQNPDPGEIPPPPEGVSVDRLAGSKLWIRCEPPGVSAGRRFLFFAQVGLVAVFTLPISITVVAGLFSKSVEPGLQLALIPFALILLGFAISLHRTYLKLRRDGECEEEVELTSTELVIRQKTGSKPSTRRVPVEDLETLEVDREGVLVLTKAESFHLATGADSRRHYWLRKALETHLIETAAP